ncbi:hypothetical protein BJ508DRAFT_327039 [Ascobolus immersus RN42]|uniref:VPS37 C-terminal domain-containing protein n=1 Tax=Ascobolus immersus RN42 TaxID=1160509 RepID=A0A3N4I941_ASCIM|nr:hypothetical protein BJ508DRAFT_327039 [Ascobolus immersus RN42]
MSTPPPLPPPPPAHLTYPTSASPIPTTSASLPPRPPKPSSPSPHQSTQPPEIPAPPPIDPNFLPPFLKDKSIADLQHLLNSPALLQALYTAHHPAAQASSQTLQSSLATTKSLALNLSSLEQQLHTQRAQTEALLASTKALEHAWREKEAEMYRELKRWSEVGLYQRLEAGIAEGERLSQQIEEEFLRSWGGSGKKKDKRGKKEKEKDSGEDTTESEDEEDEGSRRRALEEFVKQYVEVRKLVHLRKERKARWDEGRIGGWR